MLDIDKTQDVGLRNIQGCDDIVTMIMLSIFDIDQVSGYPSDGLAANVSKDTTSRELLEIEGIEKEEFKLNNIEFMYGQGTYLGYMSNMCNFPTMEQLYSAMIK